MTPQRCSWAENDALMTAYHDDEWGVPEYDSRALWEKLMLDGFQAGLSWRTILYKRAAFREAFHGFEPVKVAQYGEADIARLMDNSGIVRSRAKIEATIAGARVFVAMAEAGEDFSKFVWTLAGGKPIETTGCCSGQDSSVRRDVEGFEKTWIQVRGAGDCVCLDAGNGNC